MSSTQAIYYRDSRRRQPVEEFIDSLPVKHQVAVDLAIDRLNGLSPSEPPLAFPASSQIDGELRELRCHYGPVLYRVLYRRSRNLFVLLHMLRKNTGTVPTSDIQIAKLRWEDFKTRMDVQPRRPPRAAGHDAP
ncbi:MAG TPA: type II toxin-antitoxin system RelE/ParE family toxin [Solirubrobacteraceae bacterium]|jgi:phage-related protein|nr:type II toxin-antitoxin system RelE/ParE family toxin [Solirubrobacteraceae bacterium]